MKLRTLTLPLARTLVKPEPPKERIWVWAPNDRILEAHSTTRGRIPIDEFLALYPNERARVSPEAWARGPKPHIGQKGRESSGAPSGDTDLCVRE